MPREDSRAGFFADWALLPSGWARDVRLEVDAAGAIVAVTADARADGAERLGRAILPGMPNLHSHAFQRSFAGRAEHAHDGKDDFWSWRESMYRAAGALNPETLRGVAHYVFCQMLKAGYTSVAEFHYLHAAPGGEPYRPDDAMASAIVDAARDAGIGLTLLPVLYDRGGFGGEPLRVEQRRFHIELERVLGWIAAGLADAGSQTRWGLAPHSLRAVAADRLIRAVDELARIDPGAPIHIHIAEQIAEVDGFRRAHGRSPIGWLVDNLPVDERWCLVHATHAEETELRAVAKTGAVVGLCPTTEANLGDGFFDLPVFTEAGGLLGIGSDSNVAIDPFEELRLLEYGQRLRLRRRNIPGGHSGSAFWRKAASGGARALGQKVGALAAGFRADLVVFDPSSEVEADSPEFWLDSAMFAALGRPIRHVMAGGRWVVRDGRYNDEETIAATYRKALAALDVTRPIQV